MVFQEKISGNITFENVDFRYPSRSGRLILKQFSVSCESGHTTALVGASGSGKSTSVALLQRFYDPWNGSVQLDGHDLRSLNIRWLRSLMGVVQQEPVLFDMSIRENIAYGDTSREVSQTEIEEAARKSNIHDFIVTLPNVRFVRMQFELFDVFM